MATLRINVNIKTERTLHQLLGRCGLIYCGYFETECLFVLNTKWFDSVKHLAAFKGALTKKGITYS